MGVNGFDWIAARFENVKSSGDGFTARCPAHEDKQNSLSISQGRDGRALLHCHAGCHTDAVVRAAGLKMGDLFPNKRANRPEPVASKEEPEGQKGLTLEQYARRKRLPVEFLNKVGVTDRKTNGLPAVRIAYRNADGDEIAIRWRIAWSGDRFRWGKNAQVGLYGLWRLGQPKSVFLVEGESDAQTLWAHNVPALGLPGAAWLAPNRPDIKYLQAIPRIYAVIEPDQGGDALRERLVALGPDFAAKIFLVKLGDAKDVSDLHVRDPQRFWTRLFRARCAAERLSDYLKKEADAKREEQLRQCEALAKSPALLNEFAEAYIRCGVVGELRLAKLLYLALTSRVLDRPISVALKGPSSGGKSFLLDELLQFFPAEAYLKFSSMSDRALAYTAEDLSHRFLVVAEYAGLASDFLEFMIRTLLSEGRIVYEFVDGAQTRRLEREGPTGLVFTTTRLRVHPENETRVFSLTVNDTREQTKAVMRKLAEQQGTIAKTDLSKWHALQAWIQLGDRKVFIPYASQLAELIEPEAVRMRRDFKQLLNLIQAHAILHQATRDRDAEGRIVATVDDYAVIRELVHDIMAESVETRIPKTVRETVKAIRDLTDQQNRGGVSLKALGMKLKLDKSAVSRRVNAAIDHGFVCNEEERKGRTARLRIAEALPEQVPLLPKPEVLHGCAVDPIRRHKKNISSQKGGLRLKNRPLDPTPRREINFGASARDDLATPQYPLSKGNRP